MKSLQRAFVEFTYFLHTRIEKTERLKKRKQRNIANVLKPHKIHELQSIIGSPLGRMATCARFNLEQHRCGDHNTASNLSNFCKNKYRPTLSCNESTQLMY